MKLNELFCTNFECTEWASTDIKGLCYDSRRARPGFAFFAISGTADDGHRYIVDAMERGACAFFVERKIDLKAHVPQLVVANARRALANAARRFYCDPSFGMTVSAVTGTNGKTSTVYLTRHILAQAGIPSGLMSTVLVDDGRRKEVATHTTPESLEIQSYLSEMRSNGLTHALMEASSHALNQGRLAGLKLASGVFTNLTPDHLDYHRDMSHYLASKARLFEMLHADAFAVLNRDDPASTKLASCSLAKPLWFGMGGRTDVHATVCACSAEGTRLVLTTPVGSSEISTRLVGLHNVQNILAAAANAYALGISFDNVCRAIESFAGTPGRLQRVDCGQPFTVLVDYAHTQDALEKVLQALVSVRGDGRLLLVFGCGGDRDKIKRPQMGKAASRYADEFWVTSDNPRSEDPQAIIDDILVGINGTPCHVETDRRAAIHDAIKHASPGDIVLIAGKGHEDYQIIGNERLHFDDVEEAANILNSGIEALRP
ncbi:MAG: UDP-N-acetylmuramoyl-L-alanyl-D-glutamate--2,6-diaminopimelate ligase [Planctomycetota bacterium]|nr:UDP-N-acetylmuramoyl-L-alanyl-D-glutamate--2,6-diaminopimelate ligase [Planctomycetota bacterium]MDA1140753.1 UDP-N-acetylmuramoyl-L-alanyl-D-glutamate--2,6-diaminopimelate ligase [Planctomycetota bacterium]